MKKDYIVNLVGGTSLVVPEEKFKDFMEIISSTSFWDSVEAEWVGDSCVTSVEEL